MERGEPALVPQWYRLANGNASNNAVRNSSKHSDENSLWIGTRSRLLGDQDRNLPRSLSSNGSLSRGSGRSQAYSSFRRSRDRNQDKDLDSRDRENRTVLVDNGFDHRDSFLRTEKDAFRHSQSTVMGRQIDSWPKRTGSITNSSVLPGGSAIGSITKTAFEKDFPSLRAEGKQSFSDGGGLSPLSVRTAVQSLPIGSPIIIGTSALAQVPVKVETTATLLSPVLQSAPICQASGGSTMAEALAQAPSQVDTLQLSSDTQRIEELTLKKCKQLIPVTPSMPKVSTPSMMEKTKSKVSRIGDSSSLTKVGQQSHANLSVRPPGRFDNAKSSVVGSFQVLNREKNGISPTAKDNQSAGKTNPVGLVPSAAAFSLKSPSEQRLKIDNKNGAATQNFLAERKLLSQAQNRNDFFNLLRKKSLTNSSAIPDPSSTVEPISETENTQISSSMDIVKNGFSSESGLDCQTENGYCLNGELCASDESEIFCADNGETSPPDIAVDPEEEAFLQSLGWDKNAGEEALTEEEIHAFLNKYEKRRPLKVVPADLNGSIFPSAHE